MPFSLLRSTCINALLLVSIFLCCIPELLFLSDNIGRRVSARLDLSDILATDVVLQVVVFLFLLVCLYTIFITTISAALFTFIRHCKISVREKYLVSGLCFAIASHWLILLNQFYFPSSIFLSNFLVPVDSYIYKVYLVFVFFLLVVIFLAALKILMRKYLKYFLGFIGILGAALYFISSLIGTLSNASGEHHHPNIVFIGIDSFRYDLLTHEDGSVYSEYAPNIARFLGESVYFNNAYTPMARTQVALSSLYTGVYPYSHGVRYNLMPDKLRNATVEWLPDTLKKYGYKTYFGLDDRRFASIDHHNGFDHVVGPRRGASDYILGMINDNPLSNLIGMHRFSRYLFPYGYVNRGVANLYHPELFVEELLAQTKSHDEHRKFIATHFTLPHWPYYWAISGAVNNNSDLPPSYLRYLSTMKTMDDTFQQYIDSLHDNKTLENAIVVLYSDHGEGWASLDPIDLALDPSYDLPTMKGHGVNVLNEQQVRVILAFRKYGDKQYTPSMVEQLVSLVDVHPTVLSALHLDYSLPTDGMNLMPWIVDPSTQVLDRYVYTESGLYLNGLDDIDNNLGELLEGGLKIYQFKKNGEYELKIQAVNGLLDSKQFAVYSSDGRAAARFPTKMDNDYYFIKGESGEWQLDDRSEKNIDVIDALNHFIEKSSFKYDEKGNSIQ